MLNECVDVIGHSWEQEEQVDSEQLVVKCEDCGQYAYAFIDERFPVNEKWKR